MYRAYGYMEDLKHTGGAQMFWGMYRSIGSIQMYGVYKCMEAIQTYEVVWGLPTYRGHTEG